MRALQFARGVSFIGCALLPALASADWDNYQGNPRRTGYVAEQFDASKFHRVWQWKTPRAATTSGARINPVTISGGLIAVTDDPYHDAGALYVLRERDGSLKWQHDFPAGTPAINPPTLNNGKVLVATSGHEQTQLFRFDARTGQLHWQAPFESQWGHYLAPLVTSGRVDLNGGYAGGVYSFDGSTGAEHGFVGLPQVDMYTPASDGRHDYAYAGGRLNIIERGTGAFTWVYDPAPTTTGYSYIGAPVVTPRRRVIALSGENFSGRASSSTGGYYERELVSFDPQARTVEWRSQDQFITQPAVAHGLVFAGSSSQMRLEALSEIDGVEQWSWRPEDGSTAFCRNVIATDSHVFVSTNVAVHAVDLKTRRSVWSLPVPGELALSGHGTLTINEGCRESTGRLVAVRLK